MTPLRRILRMAGPAMAAPATGESLRAALGAGAGLLACNLVLAALGGGGAGLLLIAPFGASAFLVFVVPNSPLAQPWSVIVGNGLAALVALAVLAAGLPAPLAAPVAVALAVLGMAATRSLHPPSGAVALATVIAAPGWEFAANPVLAGSVALVLAGVVWNRATGRVYPFRLPAGTGAHRTADPAPDRRLGLDAAAIAAVLDRLRMAPNIGVEDAARVIEAAETEAAAHHLHGLVAGDVMSRDLVTVRPDDRPAALAALFRRHRFKTLPVTEGDGRYLGLLDQQALLGVADGTGDAASLMEPAQAVGPQTGLAALMALLQDGAQQAVPVTTDGRLVGLVTRSDLIALLAARLRDVPAP
jgi:CBS domain-containing membrane protein